MKYLIFCLFSTVSYSFCLASSNAVEVLGNRFVLAQLKTTGENHEWDPYPWVSRDILSFLQQTTSVKADLQRRIITLADPLLFQTPFILFTGQGYLHWSSLEKENLKKYLSKGGFIFVEDREGEKNGEFDRSFRLILQEIFPDKPLTILPREHAVYRSFYLLRSVSGRKMNRNYLEGLDVDGRTALIYSQNDVLGAWNKDLFGNYVFECFPGGESQRWEAQKLLMNLILYSVTGTYKTDTIHLPYIQEKLR